MNLLSHRRASQVLTRKCVLSRNFWNLWQANASRAPDWSKSISHPPSATDSYRKQHLDLESTQILQLIHILQISVHKQRKVWRQKVICSRLGAATNPGHEEIAKDGLSIYYSWHILIDIQWILFINASIVDTLGTRQNCFMFFSRILKPRLELKKVFLVSRQSSEYTCVFTWRIRSHKILRFSEQNCSPLVNHQNLQSVECICSIPNEKFPWIVFIEYWWILVMFTKNRSVVRNKVAANVSWSPGSLAKILRYSSCDQLESLIRTFSVRSSH